MSNCKGTHEGCDKINDQFFKIILEPKDAKLGIPPVFARKLSAMHDLNQGVLHNRRTNETWMVNIERKKNKMSFTKGWLEFVAHYKLMEGDFVTFEHIGEMQFNVRIFGNTACEKPLQPPLKEEVPLLPYPTSANSHRLAKRRRGKQCYTNSLPYFSKRMTESYFKSFPRIQIPIDFAEQHGLFELPRKAVLKDELGNRHIVNVSCSSEETQKRIRLGCGMTTFFNTNNVKVGDDCIFELDLNAKQHNQLIFNVAILKHRNGSNIYKHWGIGL